MCCNIFCHISILLSVIYITRDRVVFWFSRYIVNFSLLCDIFYVYGNDGRVRVWNWNTSANDRGWSDSFFLFRQKRMVNIIIMLSDWRGIVSVYWPARFVCFCCFSDFFLDRRHPRNIIFKSHCLLTLMSAINGTGEYSSKSEFFLRFPTFLYKIRPNFLKKISNEQTAFFEFLHVMKH